MVYWAFLSSYEENEDEDFPEDISITATSKEEARVKIKEYYREKGYRADLSATSEEVIITDPTDGRERVYYGFSEE